MFNGVFKTYCPDADFVVIIQSVAGIMQGLDAMLQGE